MEENPCLVLDKGSNQNMNHVDWKRYAEMGNHQKCQKREE